MFEKYTFVKSCFAISTAIKHTHQADLTAEAKLTIG